MQRRARRCTVAWRIRSLCENRAHTSRSTRNRAFSMPSLAPGPCCSAAPCSLSFGLPGGYRTSSFPRARISRISSTTTDDSLAFISYRTSSFVSRITAAPRASLPSQGGSGVCDVVLMPVSPILMDDKPRRCTPSATNLPTWPVFTLDEPWGDTTRCLQRRTAQGTHRAFAPRIRGLLYQALLRRGGETRAPPRTGALRYSFAGRGRAAPAPAYALPAIAMPVPTYQR